MPDRTGHFRRADARARTRRDVDRFRRREPEERFWRSLALIGSVGWPIVLAAIGGALLGRYFDDRLGTGLRLTLTLLTLGIIIGCSVAFRTLRGDAS